MTKKITKSIKEATITKGLIKKSPISHGVGRRKSAVARVWLRHGTGDIIINHKNFVAYCSTDVAKRAVLEPIALVGAASEFFFDINVKGGGIHSQADAIKLGISRSLATHSEEYRKLLKEKGYLTVDSRLKERKKPGQAGARKKFQFVKR